MCGDIPGWLLLGYIRKQASKQLSSVVPVSALLEFCPDFPQLWAVIETGTSKQTLFCSCHFRSVFYQGTKSQLGHNWVALKVRRLKKVLLC